MRGRIFLIVGNSGSGKDSIIREIVRRQGVRTVKRFITRQAHESEDFVPVSHQEFEELSRDNNFFLEWGVYGKEYGVPMEAVELCEQGYNVVINVSRQVVDKAKENDFVRVVEIRASEDVMKKRILNRGREPAEEIDERLSRFELFKDFDRADFVIDNSGSLSSAVEQLSKFIFSEK